MEIDRRALLAALAGVAIIPLFEVADSKFRNLLSIPASTGFLQRISSGSLPPIWPHGTRR